MRRSCWTEADGADHRDPRSDRRFGALTAVDRLNLSVAEGEIFGLVGPDGAGKTTTLRMLCGLVNPTEGSARVAGHDVARESQAVKDQIGYMAQRFGLYLDLTVEENMFFYADLFGIVGEERRGPDRPAAAHDPHGAVPGPAGRKAFRRHETEAGADVHAAAPAADPVSGRADQRRGPGFPPRFLDHSLSAAEGRHHHFHDHRLPGRGRALQPRGPDAQGQADPLRHAGTLKLAAGADTLEARIRPDHPGGWSDWRRR